jgi:hypothetical protein
MADDSLDPAEEQHDESHEHASLRQVLHAATGDRDAEAEALADETPGVDVDDAKVAVQKAHGESVEGSIPDHDLARPADARDIAEEQSG